MEIITRDNMQDIGSRIRSVLDNRSVYAIYMIVRDIIGHSVGLEYEITDVAIKSAIIISFTHSSASIMPTFRLVAGDMVAIHSDVVCVLFDDGYIVAFSNNETVGAFATRVSALRSAGVELPIAIEAAIRSTEWT